MLQVLYMMVVVTSLFVVSVMSEASSPEEKPYKVEAVANAARTSTSRSVYRVPLLVFQPEGEHGTTGTRVAMPDVVLAEDDNGFALSAIPKPAVEAPKPPPLPPSPKKAPKAPPVIIPKEPQTPREQIVTVTAYSSRPEETDDTPFTTASGAEVSWGVVASNTLPFGTRIRFPDLYGAQEFVVADRMNARYSHGRMDIWMPSYVKARRFGAKTTRVEIVAHPRG